MGSDGSVPWHNRPARPFPVHLWMRRRYGFLLPPLFFAQPTHAIADDVERHPFPAKVWVEKLEKSRRNAL